jgi:hypothetical protein
MKEMEHWERREQALLYFYIALHGRGEDAREIHMTGFSGQFNPFDLHRRVISQCISGMDVRTG